MLTVKYLIMSILIQLKIIEADIHGTIVGGEQTTVSKYPHSAFIDAQCRYKEWVCGSSILNQRIILTAAHCVVDCQWKQEKYSKLIIYVGHSNLRRVTVKRQIVDIKMHEKYDNVLLDNDIAIGILSKDLPLGKNIKRVVLPITFPKNAKAVYVAGWGITQVNDKATSNTLKHVVQIIRPKQTCNLIGHLNPGMFCAGNSDRKTDYAASGDSGSALVFKSFIQVGIVSFRILKYPALHVYTNVSYYYDWIRMSTQQLYCAN